MFTLEAKLLTPETEFALDYYMPLSKPGEEGPRLFSRALNC